MPILALSFYLISWSLIYSLPADSPLCLDLRESPKQKAYKVSLCASLADNPLGFPGHAYVLFSESEKINPEKDYALGYMPQKYWDQITSLFAQVPGVLLENVRGNSRNLDRITVLVSEKSFLELKRRARNWQSGSFQAGKHDCVSFASFVSTELGLKTPASTYIFPQDFLRELKDLNKGRL